ncbi:hypothetical protein HDU96_010025 [Phlyctochytrium bullatum]|nr:hypothetical protein HDU96_010025 [Phlyctochytrium bullatum]
MGGPRRWRPSPHNPHPQPTATLDASTPDLDFDPAVDPTTDPLTMSTNTHSATTLLAVATLALLLGTLLALILRHGRCSARVSHLGDLEKTLDRFDTPATRRRPPHPGMLATASIAMPERALRSPGSSVVSSESAGSQGRMLPSAEASPETAAGTGAWREEEEVRARSPVLSIMVERNLADETLTRKA